MSAANGGTMNLAAILTSTSLVYSVYCCWKFDRCYCLVPKRRDWFRALLCWLMIMANMTFSARGIGWAYVKYKLGWVIIPQYGAIPIPDMLWEEKYKRFGVPLELSLNTGFSLIISLSAEEGLYWFHLIRAIRRPRFAGSWLRSYFFYSWIGITVILTVATMAVTWTDVRSLDFQLARSFISGGITEGLVILMGSIVIWQFPKFLKDVKESGAGPEILARLHFYNEANKVRTFFRVVFCLCVTIVGVDGLTEAKVINTHPLAADMLNQLGFLSYFFALIISSLVYLPRDWSLHSKNARPRIMVANPLHPVNPNLPRRNRTAEDLHGTSFALVSLLREGGQWDYDHDVRVKRNHNLVANEMNESQLDFSSRPGTSKGVEMDLGSSLFGDAVVVAPVREMPSVLQDWAGPFSAPISERPVPKELKIMVEQEQEIHDSVSNSITPCISR